jgi:hypothetical protein
VAALRQKYAPKLAALEERVRRADQAVAREQEQSTGSRVDTAVSLGSAVLGALLGRKTVSAASVGRVSTVLRRAGNAAKQAGDVERADETAAVLKRQLAELEAQVQAEVDGLAATCDAGSESLEEIAVRPRAADVTVQFCGIGWLPHIEDGTGRLRPA